MCIMITRINIFNVLCIFLCITWSIHVIECHELMNKVSTVEMIPGLKLFFNDKKISIKFNIGELFSDKTITSRGDHGGTSNKTNLLQRFGAILMMIPLAMQIMFLPGALASIKMSLLKSVFVGKLALIIMIYNLFRHFQPNRELVVVHKQPVEHYNHYYSPLPNNEEDDKGWFG